MFEDDAHRLPDPEWLDRLLREDAKLAAALPDAGFTERVMQQLPARRLYARRSHHGWIAPVFGTAAIAGVAAFSPVMGDLLSPLHVLAHGGAPSLRALLPVLALAGAAYTAIWFSLSESR